MSRTLHIVASCAQTKGLDVPADLQLGAVAAMSSAEGRARTWVRRRDATRAEAVPAGRLYSGTYWANVRQLVQRATELGYDAHLWIASAGYGLVAAGKVVKPYSATFARGMSDSVAPARLGRADESAYLRRWWSELNARKGLAALAKRDGGASFLIVAGPAYISAMSDDLARCAERLRHRERLVIVTSDASSAPATLASNVVLSAARLIHKVGGALPMLHARVAEHLVTESRGRPLNAYNLRDYTEAILEAQPAWTVPSRDKGSDKEILSYLRKQLRSNPGLTHTRALRELRSGGMACEQKRFKALFASLAGATNAA